MTVFKRAWVLGVVGVICGPVWAQPQPPPVDLEWRPAVQTVEVGQTFAIGFYAVGTGAAPSAVADIEAAMVWNPEHIRLISNVNNGPYNWLFSGFPTLIGLDPGGLNITHDDGNAQYFAARQLNPFAPFFAPPEGRLIATFLFEALAETPATFLETPSMLGLNHSRVLDGLTPNVEVTGELGRAEIRITPEPATVALLVIAGLPLLARLRRRQ